MSLLDNVLGSSVPGGNLAKPLGIALLAFLASRATGNSGAAGPGSGGALGGLLSGGLGGLLDNLTGSGPGTASIPQDQAHTAMSGGLGELLQRFQQNGYGDIVNSWIGTSANQPIAPDQLHKALGPGGCGRAVAADRCAPQRVAVAAFAGTANDGRSVHPERSHSRSGRNGSRAAALNLSSRSHSRRSSRC